MNMPNDPGGNPFNEGGQFGSNPNAVTQLFSDGGMSDGRKKALAIIILLLLLGFGAFWYMTNEDSLEDDEFAFQEPTPAQKEPLPDEVPEEIAKADVDIEPTPEAEPMPEPELIESVAPTPSKYHYASPRATSAPRSAAPADKMSRQYDESSGPAEFTWDGGPGGVIRFSSNPSMQPVFFKATSRTSKFNYRKPPAGTWYWQVSNRRGKSEVRSFTIHPPIKRNVAILNPQSNQSVSGKGGVVSWKGDKRISYYKVEVSSSGFANPQFKFATSGTHLALADVPPGSYELRVGAFSEVSGRWEYTSPISVDVQ